VYHPPRPLRTFALGFMLGGIFGIIGCGGSSIPHPKYSAQTTSALVAIKHEPPPARVENIPPRPADATTWVDGEWSWNRRRWVWGPGRWVAPPVGATYAPWVTVRAKDGSLYFAPAQWHDAHGAPIAPPKALATAIVESGAVVDAEGEMERTTVTGGEE
jgi:hypothetical protein